jgi:hypothetical protein
MHPQWKWGEAGVFQEPLQLLGCGDRLGCPGYSLVLKDLKKAISGGGELYYITFYLPYAPPMDTAMRYRYLNYLDSYPKFSALTCLSSWISLKHKHSFHNSGSNGLSGPDRVLLFNKKIL